MMNELRGEWRRAEGSGKRGLKGEWRRVKESGERLTLLCWGT